MKVVVISGKGGTGKTLVSGGFSILSGPEWIVADADVDAANLHLITPGRVMRSEPFSGGKIAEIDPNKCDGCGACYSKCRFKAIVKTKGIQVDPVLCEGCGVCQTVCPQQAVHLKEQQTGVVRMLNTEAGMLVDADLIAGADGSGKLVTAVRKEAEMVAGPQSILIDGSPGIGCPVMASMTGCDVAILVTEPSQSALSDLKRVVEVAEHFQVPKALIVNKWDLHTEMADQVEAFAKEKSIRVLGRIPYDRQVMRAVNSGRSPVQESESVAGKALRDIWMAFKKWAPSVHSKGEER